MPKILRFLDPNESPNPGLKNRHSVNKKKITYHLADFAVLADHKVQMKESEKRDKYLDLARQLKECE